MLFRLVAASVVVGTIVVMSPVRQGAPVPALPDGTGTLVAGLLKDGLQNAFDPSAPSPQRESEPMRAAIAAAIVRGVVAEQSERVHRTLTAIHEPAGKRAVSSDTLRPGDRIPSWRGTVPVP